MEQTVTLKFTLEKDPEGISVLLDGKPIEYAIASNSQSWIFDIGYSHSVHIVVVYFNGEATPEPLPIALIATVSVAIFTLAAAGLLVIHKKHRK